MSEILTDKLELEDTSHWHMYFFSIKGFAFFLLGIPFILMLCTGFSRGGNLVAVGFVMFVISLVVFIPLTMVSASGSRRRLPREVTFDGDRLRVKYNHSVQIDHGILLKEKGLGPCEIRYRLGLSKEDQYGDVLERKECVIVEVPSQGMHPRLISVGRGNDTDQWVTELENAGVRKFKDRVAYDWQGPLLIGGFFFGGFIGFLLHQFLDVLSFTPVSKTSEFAFILNFALTGTLVGASFLSLDRWRIDRQPGGFVGTFILRCLVLPVFPFVFGVRDVVTFDFAGCVMIPVAIVILSTWLCYWLKTDSLN